MVEVTFTRSVNAQEILLPGGYDPMSPNTTSDFNFVSNTNEVITFTEVISTTPGDADYDNELAAISGKPPPDNTFPNGNSSVFGDIDDNDASGIGNVGTEFVTINGVPYDYENFGGGEFDIGMGNTATFVVIYVPALNRFWAIPLDNDVDPSNGNTKQSIGELDGDTTFYFSDFVCFTEGSMIKTEEGLRRIEDLQAGDFVETLDQGLQPVRWIGSRKISRTQMLFNKSLRPVKIRAEAIGPGVPFSDMMVSQQHRILIRGQLSQCLFGESELLAPAKALINDQTITCVNDLEDVTYYHILFDEHQLVTVDGLISESFYPHHQSLCMVGEACKREIFTLFPELSEDIGSYGKVARPVLKKHEARTAFYLERRQSGA